MTPALPEVVRKFFKIQPFELKTEDPIIKAILSDSYMEIIRLYIENPFQLNSLLESNMLSNDTLQPINIKENQLIKNLLSCDIDIIKCLCKEKIIHGQMAKEHILLILQAGTNLGKNAAEIISCAPKLINSAGSVYKVAKILSELKYLQDLKNAPQIVKLMDQFTPNISSLFSSQLFKKIEGLGENALEILNRIPKPLFQGKENFAYILVRLIEYQSDIIELFYNKKIIDENTRESALYSVLQAGNDLGKNAVEIISSAPNLINSTRSVEKNANILEQFKHLKDFEETASQIVKYVGQLVSEHVSCSSLSDLFQAIKYLGKNALEILNLIPPHLFQEEQDMFNFAELIKNVAKFGDKAFLILNLSQPLIHKQMNAEDITLIYNTVNELEKEIQSVISLCKHGNMDAFEISLLLQQLNRCGKNREDAMLLTQKFLPKNYSTKDVVNIFSSISNFKNPQRTASLANLLIHKKMGEDIFSLLKTINRFGDNALWIVPLTQKLISEEMNVQNIDELLKAVNELGDRAEEVVNGILFHQKKFSFEELLKLLQ